MEVSLSYLFIYFVLDVFQLLLAVFLIQQVNNDVFKVLKLFNALVYKDVSVEFNHFRIISELLLGAELIVLQFESVRIDLKHFIERLQGLLNKIFGVFHQLLVHHMNSHNNFVIYFLVI
jgi:hypothetical protein